MVALRVSLLPCALYSMRMPFTFQSALTYPLPPPSTIKGMFANALFLAERGSPLDHLDCIEQALVFASAFASAPIAVKSHIVRLVRLDKKGQTDALPREFAQTPQPITAVAATEDRDLAQRLVNALRRAPISLGDSESLCSVVHAELCDVQDVTEAAPVDVAGYFPEDAAAKQLSQGTLYWVHEVCHKASELVPYVFPLLQQKQVLQPTAVRVVPASGVRVLRIAQECFLVAEGSEHG